MLFHRNSFYCMYLTVPDDIDVRAGAEFMFINRQERKQVEPLKERIFKISKYDFVLKPEARMKSVTNPNPHRKGCQSLGVKCYKRKIDARVTIETKAHTPFFLSGPKFSFVFCHSTIQSWIDVTVTASQSEQKSHTSEQCLNEYNINESVFKAGNLFSKSVTSTSRIHSLLVNLVQLETKRPAQIRIKVLTRSQLTKTKLTTTIHLEWTSVVTLSKDNSRKIISLPGMLRSVTLEALNYLQNYTIDIYWIHDLFSRSSYQSHDERFCHEDVLTKTKHNYCLNYTTVQNNYLFFWNFTQYLKCYIIPSPVLNSNVERIWTVLGYIIPSNNKCPTQQSKEKVIKSWTEAYHFCKSIGGSLPLVRNRDELDEIIAFLKLSENMPPVEGLYIGLRRNFKTQVTHGMNSYELAVIFCLLNNYLNTRVIKLYYFIVLFHCHFNLF